MAAHNKISRTNFEQTRNLRTTVDGSIQQRRRLDNIFIYRFSSAVLRDVDKENPIFFDVA